MDKEDIEDMMNKLIKQIESFREQPTYEKAMYLDMSVSILRFLVGEANFLPLHYFRQAHEEAVKFIDDYRTEREKQK